jgi:DNA-directed RNA polymerase specialized sigma24 family protein
MKITLEYVIEKFDKKIERTIKNKVYNCDNDVLDIKNDIYLAMVQRKYLDRYDPKKSELSTYIYTFILNHCRNIRRDTTLKKNRGRHKVLSLDFKPNRSLYDRIPESLNYLKLMEEKDFIGRVMAEIGRNNHIYKVTYKNTNIDLKEILNMLVSGYNMAEVAKCVGMSSSNINNKFSRLATRPWVKKYFRERV